jgi:hypothetical protein
MDVRDRVGFGRVRLEHRLEARDAQDVVDFRGDRADFQRPSPVLWPSEVSRDESETTTIDEFDGSEVQQDVWALRQEPVETHLKRLGLFTCDDPAAAGDDSHIANAPTLQRERQEGPPDSVTRRVYACDSLVLVLLAPPAALDSA